MAEVTEEGRERFFSVVMALLDERQQRLMAGGTVRVDEADHGGGSNGGMSRSTVTTGAKEVHSGGDAVPADRVRRPGGPDDRVGQRPFAECRGRDDGHLRRSYPRPACDSHVGVMGRSVAGGRPLVDKPADAHPLLFANPLYALHALLSTGWNSGSRLGRLGQLLLGREDRRSTWGPVVQPWQLAVAGQVALTGLFLWGAIHAVGAACRPARRRRLRTLRMA